MVSDYYEHRRWSDPDVLYKSMTYTWYELKRPTLRPVLGFRKLGTSLITYPPIDRGDGTCLIPESVEYFRIELVEKSMRLSRCDRVPRIHDEAEVDMVA